MRVSPEARFVTLCVREPAAGDRAELASAAAAVADWDRVASLAASHRVFGFVERATRNLSVPARVRERIDTQLLETVAQRLLLERELGSVLRTLEAAGVAVIVLKGPALARMIYPDPCLRPYGDLDLAVRPADESAAAEALLGLGYLEISFPNDLAWRARASQVRGAADFHRKFEAPGGGLLVELHADTLQLGLQPRCETDRWARARPLAALPGTLVLGPEDQLVTLALHAHKHGFSRVLWLKDLDLLARDPALDWRLVAEVAAEEGLIASLWYALALTQLLLRTPVPAGPVGLARPSPLLRLLFRVVWPRRGVANLDGRMRRRAVQLVAAESGLAVLASLVLMGRRGDRARAAFDFLRIRRRSVLANP
jgi:hypothetical protein